MLIGRALLVCAALLVSCAHASSVTQQQTERVAPASPKRLAQKDRRPEWFANNPLCFSPSRWQTVTSEELEAEAEKARASGDFVTAVTRLEEALATESHQSELDLQRLWELENLLTTILQKQGDMKRAFVCALVARQHAAILVANAWLNEFDAYGVPFPSKAAEVGGSSEPEK